jgi:hypothetical protein
MRPSTSGRTLARQSFSLRPTATRRRNLSLKPPLYLSVSFLSHSLTHFCSSS